MSTCSLDYPDVEDADPIVFDENPSEYEDSPAKRRASDFQTFGGDRIIQDFGAHDADRTIRLHTQWMESTTLASLQGRYAMVGKQWKWVDQKAVEYRVFFRSLVAKRRRGYDAYEVDIEFDVLDVIEPEV